MSRMQPDIIIQKIDALEKKIDAVYASAEKTRKYFLWTTILSVAFFVLPLIGIAFALPFFGDYINSALGASMGGLDLQNIQDLQGLTK